MSAALSIRARAALAPARSAASFEAAELSYADAELGARRVACALERELGGAPIAIVPRAERATLAVLHAALETGRDLVLLHPRWTDAEQRAALAIAGSPTRVEPAALEAWLDAPTSDAWPRARLGAGEVVAFTSGSTGAPRGARLGHAALAAAAEAHARAFPFEPDDAWLGAMPLSHVGGLSLVTRCLHGGARLVLADRFEPEAFLELAARRRATIASVVPTMLERLLDRPGPSPLASLRYVLVGGAAFPAPLRRAARAAGVVALATYGLTETAAQVATQRLGAAPPGPDDDSGPPLPGVSIAIVDDAGLPVADGEVGRVRVSGATVFSGYLGAPARVEPWVDTADLGRIGDGGALVVLGRTDDVIVTGGENVHPLEVESALAALPGVRAALVFGVPDARWGQRVAVALVLEEGASLASTLHAGALDALAAFKRPRLAVSVAALPVTAAGKPDRRACAATLGERLTPLG